MTDSNKNTVLSSCAAQAADFAGLIDYAADSVVSKTILDKKVGTITLFAFDAGQGLSEHQAPYDATVQVVDGTAVIIIDGKEIQTKAGSIIVMPANIVHAVKAKEKFKMLLTMIRA